ncbi:MAG TPA: MFS transporter [Streptosporangiaceae bacterium]
MRPLRHRSFALLWGAGLVSTIGSWMQAVAVGALLISRTGQATWAVLVAAAAFLPIGLLSPVGGALADRVARRPVLIAGNVAEAAVAFALAALVGTGHEDPALLVALVAVQGAASAVVGPFQQAILPDLVPPSEFLPAIALNSAQWNLGRIAGPALAGGAIAAFGYPLAFDANAISFLAVVAALLFVRFAPPAGTAGDRLLASLRAGLAAARREPGCWAAIWTIGVVALIASPFIALVPAMAERVARGAGGAAPSGRAVAAATGVLTTAQGIGAVAGAMCLAGLAARFGRGRVLAASLAAFPLALLVYGSAQSLWWAAAGLFAVGLAYIGVLSGLSLVVQVRAPAAFRGRVLSLYLVALGVAYPVGALIQGPVADRIGIGWTTTGTALLLIAVLAVAAGLLPGVRRALFGEAPSSLADADGDGDGQAVAAEGVVADPVLAEAVLAAPAAAGAVAVQAEGGLAVAGDPGEALAEEIRAGTAGAGLRPASGDATAPAAAAQPCSPSGPLAG